MSQMELRDRRKLKRRIIPGSVVSGRPFSKTTIKDLSPELLVKIFTHFIEIEGLVSFAKNVATVCKTWWNLSYTPSLFKNIDLEDSKSILSFSEGSLCYTVTLKTPYSCASVTNQRLDSLERDRLLGVLPHIRGVKSVEINNKTIDVNTMATVAKHCPDLEQLQMKLVSRVGCRQITLEELDPILSTCGPKLKHLNFDCCEIEGCERLITEIAAKCASLEIFRWNNGYGFAKVPIDELMVRCPRLRKLILWKCDIVSTGGSDYIGFKDLAVFKAVYCRCGGYDMYNFLKNSENLEYLELIDNDDMVCSTLSGIPSNKLKYLKLELKDVSVEALEQAVNKWKRTLLLLRIFGWGCNITNALKLLLDSNPCPKLEVLITDRNCVNRSFLRMLILRCRSLRRLEFHNSIVRCKNRIKVLEFGETL